jgi:hypothetical protein
MSFHAGGGEDVRGTDKLIFETLKCSVFSLNVWSPKYNSARGHVQTRVLLLNVNIMSISPYLVYFPYYEKLDAGNVWMPEPIFMKLGIYIMVH